MAYRQGLRDIEQSAYGPGCSPREALCLDTTQAQSQAEPDRLEACNRGVECGRPAY